MSPTINDLENRIRKAKAYLNKEMTACKLGHDGTQFNLREIGYHMDTIHEIERVGLRNLNEIETVKLNRVLGTVEGTLGVMISQN